MRFNGSIPFLIPDGTAVPASCDAGFRGGRWAGTVSLQETERSLERGDVCQMALGEENLRVVITYVLGRKRYTFIALITPDPDEQL